jgi:hypothetical protein
VKRYLDDLPKTWHFRLPAVLAGLPDRLACINGRFVALEIKRSESAPRSKIQIHVLGLIEKAGGLSLFVYPENWEEVKNKLNEL